MAGAAQRDGQRRTPGAGAYDAEGDYPGPGAGVRFTATEMRTPLPR